MKKFVMIALTFMSLNMFAQTITTEKLPYYEIPEYPESYTAGTVAARLIDGLGFRYYWATEGLREEDLSFKPNEDARTTNETIEHLYSLSKVIVNATLKKANVRSDEKEAFNFINKRKETLNNFKIAADILRTSEDISIYNIIFKNDNGTSEFPFRNNINGPIADAIWHCGQVVLLRRSSGNPFNSKASLFRGKLRD